MRSSNRIRRISRFRSDWRQTVSNPDFYILTTPGWQKTEFCQDSRQFARNCTEGSGKVRGRGLAVPKSIILEWQKKLNYRSGLAFALRATDIQVTVMAINDAFAHPQAETRPHHALRREERLEYFGKHLGRHATPRIRNRQQNTLCTRAPAPRFSGAEHEPSPSRRRINRVSDKVA